MSRIDVDPAQWALLNRLLDQALDLPPDQRNEWLDSLAPEHQPLRPRLAELLSHAENRYVLATLPKLEDAGAREETGADVGPYRLLRSLGEGGMGSVWLAERSDGIMRRSVALKLPRSAAMRPEIAERIAREREILAALSHPNIARLYDAGVTQDGKPYLALEYVEGEPIHRWVEQRKLDVEARLRLFLEVAKAIAYAHGRLIVHRDIKPANIMVTKEGEVRLLDFGIAKLLDQGRAEETDLTRESGRPLTIAYASPEQIRGDTLGVSSDVYSLGVVLYELLSGVRPYRPERETPAALEEAVLTQEPIRPSDAAGDRKVRGDLDNIVLKAIRKDPADRYPTVDAFAADVERFLAGHPVLARGDSNLYRMRKFVGRHRLAVAAATIVLLSIFTGAGVAVWQAQLALAEKARAEQVKGFIASIFKDANINTGDGKPLSAIDLLIQAKERVDRSISEPEIRIELLQIIGDSLVSLHDSSATVGVLDQEIADATAHYGAEHIVTLRARLTRGWGYLLSGKMEELENDLALLLPVLERHPQVGPADLAQHFRLETHAAFQRGAFDEAAEDAEKALAFAEKAEQDDERVQILTQAAEAYSFAGKHERARESAERAHALGMTTFAGNAKHPHMLFLREIYAVVLGRSGEPDAALEQLSSALADRISLHGPDALNVGNIHNNMVSLQLQAGRIAEALDSSEQALKIFLKHTGPDSYSVVAATNARTKSLVRARRGEEALKELDGVLAFATKTFGPSHPNTLAGKASKALSLGYVGRYQEALRESEAVLTELRAANAPVPHPFFVDGFIRLMSGDIAGAEKVLEEALAKTSEAPAAWLDRANVSIALGAIRLEKGALEAARASIEPAFASFEANRKTVAPDHADALLAMGRLRIQEKRAAEALPLLERADGFWRSFDAESRWAKDSARWLARARAASK